MPATLVTVNVGRIGELPGRRGPIETAFVKHAVPGPLRLARMGLPGDEHAWEHHGGPDMAVLFYPREHYTFWRDEVGLDIPPSGAFGENFTTDGLVETAVCIGDVFRVGRATVEVSQPRSPCFKIAARYGMRNLPVLVQSRGYTGFLARVLEEGEVRAGDEITLVDRGAGRMTVARANRIAHVDRRDLDGARELAAVPALADDMRAKLERRLRGDSLAALESERLHGD